MLGKGDYAELYIKHELENNCKGNDCHTEGNMCELKEIFHRHPGKRFIVFERDFVRDVLSKYRDIPLKGRNINDRALNVASNYKHALRFYKEFLVVNSKTPSGMKVEDMVDHVLRKMFVHCKGKKLYVSSKEVFEKTKADMPAKWMFTSCFGFLMFGRQPLLGKTLTSLTEDCCNVPKKGRTATRDEAKSTSNMEREAGVGAEGDTVYKRGVPIQEKATAAHLANSSHQFMLKHFRDMLVILNSEYSLLLKELSEVNTMQRSFQGDNDIEQETFDWRKEIKGRMNDVRKKKRKMQEEEKRLHQEDTQRQVLAYYDQVGDFSVSRKKNAPPSTKTVPIAKAVTVTGNVKDAAEDASTLTNSTNLSAIPPAKMPALPPGSVQRSAVMAKVVAGNLSMSPSEQEAMEKEEAMENAYKNARLLNGIIFTLHAPAGIEEQEQEDEEV
jgi:hypothetical protein